MVRERGPRVNGPRQATPEPQPGACPWRSIAETQRAHSRCLTCTENPHARDMPGIFPVPIWATAMTKPGRSCIKLERPPPIYPGSEPLAGNRRSVQESGAGGLSARLVSVSIPHQGKNRVATIRRCGTANHCEVSRSCKLLLQVDE